MSRPRLPLETTYGRLTVIDEPDHGLKVKVRCQCGTEKWVLRSNLSNHRVSSCGSSWCRTGVRSDPKPLSAEARRSLRLPSWIPRGDVVETFNRLEGGARVVVVASHYNVHIQTLYNWLRVVKGLGGPQAYLDTIDKGAQEGVANNAPFVPRVVEPGVLPAAPPPMYRAKA